MIKTQRIEEIRRYVERNQVVSFDHLSETFNVSVNTIRRDIQKLVNDGQLKKVHGGVSIHDSQLAQYEERQIVNETAKHRIAKAGSEMVEDDDIIFVDSGTTTVYMAEYLRGKKVTVLTNNLDFIVHAKQEPNITIITTGGLFDSATNSFISLQNTNVLTSYNINKAFMATTGISMDNGVTHASPLENEIKKEVVKKSAEVNVLADRTKFDKHALITYTSLESVDCIVTDSNLSDAFLNYLEKNNVLLRIAEKA
ncbi:DeoR/GlpR family DNA-binding transcription regulator [Alteribacillus bidgolensis]|uniref:Transcriptional regulator, DeoR family n=1 Tax=Alteribacillus bidgolensis TaxID=930129 RepID=A0A1G8KBE3_9BACI|nr:DeoR/GlpR family DNA-binding transcription regulator [Alteribacillus bidgolensis]SDI40180.1 transcriptional regulator, DeoR family [Alteribacillus bidgolensis]